MWPEADLREIRAFLTLAEELRFARAAYRLGITHPRVSQIISTLETRIGGRLFERTSRQVRLTALGAQLAARLGPAHAQLLAALDHAAASTNEVSGVLRVGVTITTDLPAVHALIGGFRQQHPEAKVSLEEVSIWEPYEPLRSGKIDVLCNWVAVDEPDLTLGPAIGYYERVLAVGASHRLARRQSVSLEDLAGERVNGTPRRFPRALEDLVHPSHTPSGLPIHRTEPIESPAQAFAMVARGEIVSPTSGGLRPWKGRDGVVLIPFSDLPPMPLGLIWCTAHENARIRALAQLAADLNEPASMTRPPVPARPSGGAPHGGLAPPSRGLAPGQGPQAVQLSEIRAFLVLAEELHFARTAERLGVTHSRASQLIRTLEARVGGRLFERTSRCVRPTPLGEQLRADLTPAYMQLQHALRETHEAAARRSAHRVLRLGFVATIPGEHLATLVDRFETRHSECSVMLVEHLITGDDWDIWNPLRREATDALVYFNGFDPAREPDLMIGPVIECRERVLLVARDHRLAELPSVSVEQLAREQVVRKPPTFPASIMDLVIPPATPSGRPIIRTGEAHVFQEIMTLVARGRIVHPTAAGNALARRTDIVSVPLHGLPPLSIGLIWRTDHENADIHALADTARAMGAQGP